MDVKLIEVVTRGGKIQDRAQRGRRAIAAADDCDAHAPLRGRWQKRGTIKVEGIRQAIEEEASRRARRARARRDATEGLAPQGSLADCGHAANSHVVGVAIGARTIEHRREVGKDLLVVIVCSAGNERREGRIGPHSCVGLALVLLMERRKIATDRNDSRVQAKLEHVGLLLQPPAERLEVLLMQEATGREGTLRRRCTTQLVQRC